jgi:hypothetical protein
MDPDTYYIIEWHIFISPSTMATPVIYSIYTSNTPVFINIETLGSTSFNYKFYNIIKAYILNDNTIGATVKLQNIASNFYPHTLLAGSHIIIKRMPNANFGNFS